MIAINPSGTLAHRHYAVLRAVGSGRCELTWSCEPDLYIDGRPCCDQTAAHVLTSAGLIGHAGRGQIGERVRAQLSAAGRAVLASAPGSSMSSAA